MDALWPTANLLLLCSAGRQAAGPLCTKNVPIVVVAAAPSWARGVLTLEVSNLSFFQDTKKLFLVRYVLFQYCLLMSFAFALHFYHRVWYVVWMVHNIRKGHLSVAGGNQFASAASAASADKQSRRSTHLKKCRSVVRMNVSSECHRTPKYHLGRLHLDPLGNIQFVKQSIAQK